MRSPLVTVFDETLGLCFASTLKDMLGLAVCESVYGLLEKNGIHRGEISNRFDDTVTVLTKALGASSRVLVHRTVVEMFRQYSQRADFSYQDSLRDRLTVLREAVVASHLIPKSRYGSVDFDGVVNPKLASSAESGSPSVIYNDTTESK
jgi:hypothetical protein